MKNKTRYYLFITMLVFIGLILAVGLFLAAGFTANAFVFPQRFGDLPFTVQFAILAVIYFLVFPAVMVLIGNVYLKASGKKTWGNWLKIPLNYNSIFTVIAVYQCAFLVIEVLVSFNTAILSSKAFDSIIRVMIFTVPFIMLIFSKKIIKKLFGLTEIEGVCETGDEDKIDPDNFTIRQPVYALVIYIIITVMFTGIFGIIIGGYIENNFRFENLLAALIFLPLASLGPFLIIIRSRWKLVVKGKQIKFTAYFGRTKSFTFADITRVKHGIRYTKTERLNALDGYKDKKKLFYVAENCPGYNEFVQRLKDEGVNIEW